MERSHDEMPEWDEEGPAPGSDSVRNAPSSEVEEVAAEAVAQPQVEETPEPKKDSAPEGASDKRSMVNIAIMAGVLILVFLAIVFIPQWLRQEKFEDDKYNNFEFVHDSDGFWNTVVNKGNQPYALTFYYHPRELEEIVVEQNIRNKFFDLQSRNGTIFISVDPNKGDNRLVIAGVEISKITGTRFGLLDVNTRSGFLVEPAQATTNTNTPVVTCDNANETVMVVAIAVTNKNLVSSRGNCIILESASSNESVMVADRLMYSLLGIMS